MYIQYHEIIKDNPVKTKIDNAIKRIDSVNERMSDIVVMRVGIAGVFKKTFRFLLTPTAKG